jgi:hypothetical protein
MLYLIDKEISTTYEKLTPIQTVKFTSQTKPKKVNNHEKRPSQQRKIKMNDLKELVAIPLREKIPHFSGRLDGILIIDWFKQAERVAKGGNWSKEQMKRYFPERFLESALSFQENLDDPDNPESVTEYNEWKDLIIKEFKDPSENQISKNELSEIKQKANERVRDFRARLEKLFAKVYNEKLFHSTNEDMTVIRNDILKNAFELGLKGELLPGYEKRVPVNADYPTCVATETEVEKVTAGRKKF